MRTDYFDSLKVVQKYSKKRVAEVASVAISTSPDISTGFVLNKLPHILKTEEVAGVATIPKTEPATPATPEIFRSVAKEKIGNSIYNSELNKFATPSHLPHPKIEDMTEVEQIDFLERAAIMEFDGGLSRNEAEQEAFKIIKENTCAKLPIHN